MRVPIQVSEKQVHQEIVDEQYGNRERIFVMNTRVCSSKGDNRKKKYENQV